METLFCIKATFTCSSCSKACLLRLPVAWKVCNFIQKLSARGISKAPFFSVSLETFVLALRGPLGFFFEEARFSRFTVFFFGGWLWTGILLWIKRGFIASTGARKQRVFSAPKELWNISYTSSYDTNSIAFLQNVVRPGLFPFPWAAWPTKSWEDSGKSSEPMNSKRNTDIMPMDLHFCLNP